MRRLNGNYAAFRRFFKYPFNTFIFLFIFEQKTWCLSNKVGFRIAEVFIIGFVNLAEK
jgi:hypothetical protein